MKITPVVLLAASAVNAGVLKPRQFSFGSLFGGGALKVASVEKIAPEVRPNAIRSVQSLGPITLKAVCLS
jgi:hypothetical protein